MSGRRYTRSDWVVIQAFIDEGHGFIHCREKFGIAHATWKSAIQRGDLKARLQGGVNGDDRRLYDWAAVQAYYEQGYSFRETQKHFGFSNAAWHKAKIRGDITPRTGRMSIEELLIGPRCRGHVKSRLLRAGLIENVCSRCGLTEWLGGALTMHIDHINGIRGDHRLENLRMLCPNCHSQTETYGGRNLKRKRSLQEARPAV